MLEKNRITKGLSERGNPSGVEVNFGALELDHGIRYLRLGWIESAIGHLEYFEGLENPLPCHFSTELEGTAYETLVSAYSQLENKLRKEGKKEKRGSPGILVAFRGRG